jgi:hypothetical protein
MAANCSTLSRMMAAMRESAVARSTASICDQVLKADCAASIAAFVSAAPDHAMVPITAPVAGSVTSC